MAETIYKSDSTGEVNAPSGISTMYIYGDIELTHNDSGIAFLVMNDAVITLPKSNQGLVFAFANGGVDGTVQITIVPQPQDGISGTILLATSVTVKQGNAGESIVNTKATATIGDCISLIATGTEGEGSWLMEKNTGTWV